MKRFKIITALLLLSSAAFIHAGKGEKEPLLKNTTQMTRPGPPPLTFMWVLDNIPGRKATVWPATAAIVGSMTAPAGWMSCCNEPASVAMATIGSSLLFYSGSCLLAACFVSENPKKQS